MSDDGRVLPGTEPGWGISWWLAEQGIHSVRDVAAMTPEQRLRLLCDFYEAEAAGWAPPVADEDLLPPRHHFCEPRLLPKAASEEFRAVRSPGWSSRS